MGVGEIHWVGMPVRGGHAQAGRRPAVVVQRATDLPTVLVVPLTSQLDALRFNGTVLVEADSQNGLRRPSVALVFQLTAVDRRHIADRLGSVSKAVGRNLVSS
ncbi:MAG TPA: type II toxin-antitoxin system PemK/MazF family toxin [Pyrinomonadaceae bacterium]|nr:type II toxin-antitoxin system PemK/MazF family toxin [Pyrinomonadaceae bacterium]